MIEKLDKSIGIIIEFKITKDDMEVIAKDAIKKIEEKEYYEVLKNDKVKTIYKYAMIFNGKQCIVK